MKFVRIALARAQLHRLREKSILRWILGGAAVHRCDKQIVFSIGFSRCGKADGAEDAFSADVKSLFHKVIIPAR